MGLYEVPVSTLDLDTDPLDWNTHVMKISYRNMVEINYVSYGYKVMYVYTDSGTLLSPVRFMSYIFGFKKL